MEGLDAVFEIDRGLDAVLQHGARYDPDRRYVDQGGTRRGKLLLTHEVIVSDLMKGVKFSRKNWVFASHYDHSCDCYEIYFTGPDVPHCSEGGTALRLHLADLASIPKGSKVLERFATAPGMITLDDIQQLIGKSSFDPLPSAIGSSIPALPVPSGAMWVGTPHISGIQTTGSTAVSMGSVGTIGTTTFNISPSAPSNVNEGAMWFDQDKRAFRKMINGSWTVLERNQKLVEDLLGGTI